MKPNLAVGEPEAGHDLFVVGVRPLSRDVEIDAAPPGAVIELFQNGMWLASFQVLIFLSAALNTPSSSTSLHSTLGNLQGT